MTESRAKLDETLRSLERVVNGTRAWQAGRWNAAGGVKTTAMWDFNTYLVAVAARVEKRGPEPIPDLGAAHLPMQLSVFLRDVMDVADRLSDADVDELATRTAQLREILF